MASGNSSESDLLVKELKEPIPLAEYLFRRLKEMGVETIHGVPGDYNLTALDFIPKNGLKWAGNCNELNAGYAADGYARVKGMGALVTTFGVGELSALNALAGAYSEYVPVVHIVGQPTTAAQADSLLLHHTLGNGDYNAFVNMSRPISAEIAALKNPHEAAAQIDHALQTCWQKSRPVYIALPTDLTFKKVEGARLKTPINLELKANDAEQEKYVVDVVLKYLHAAKNPVILVDACAIRHRVLKEVHALVKTSGLPTFVTPMGKGAVDETLPNYGGVYAGDGSNAGVRERVESSDLVLSIGGIKSDFNTAGFTYKVSQLNTIDFHSDYIQVKYSNYPGVRMAGVLSAVIKDIESSSTQDDQGRHRSTSISVKPGPTPSNDIPSHLASDSSSSEITHSWFWPRIGQWLAAGDIVLTETGTANFGIWETRFAKDVVALSQVLWGSIGYSVGAMQGAAQAATELGEGRRRTVLFVGDGSFQLTVQEVSTAIRLGLKPIIFVICNHGYTIERYIHGWEDPYNDVQEWSYKAIPATFGAKPESYTTHVVKTRAELDTLLGEEEFSKDGKDGKLRFVELHMPWDDAPDCLKSTAAAAAKRNA